MNDPPKVVHCSTRYIQMEEEVNADIDRLVDIKQEVIKTIEELNTDEYDILHKIYIQGMTFKEVAAVKDKSYSAITTIHGRALADLQKLLNERVERPAKSGALFN